MRFHRRMAVVGTLAGALLAAGCRGADSTACTEVREPADPLSFSHVIDPDSVSYQTDPPTSGPHLAAPVPTGILTEPIADPIQVRILEAGSAIVQWEGLDGPTVDELERLAGPTVVVAPGVDLPGPIVATAWTWKLTCDELDPAALDRFVDTRAGFAPGTD